MKEEGKKRPPRIPLTPEEVAELIEIKKIREFNKTRRFKQTLTYKILNCFNILCFFIFCELIISFFGPCNYQTHYTKNLSVEYGDTRDENNERMVSEINIVGVNNKKYKLVVHEFIKAPDKYSAYTVGKDFLLQKELKSSVQTSDKYYRILRASPMLFLSVFLGIFSIIFFSYNLNQVPHSLRAISIINALTVFSFIVI